MGRNQSDEMAERPAIDERESGWRSAPLLGNLEPWQERQLRVRFVKVLAESYDNGHHFSQVAAKLIAALKEPLEEPS